MHDPEYRRALKDFQSFIECLSERITEIDDTIPELPTKDIVCKRPCLYIIKKEKNFLRAKKGKSRFSESIATLDLVPIRHPTRYTSILHPCIDMLKQKLKLKTDTFLGSMVSEAKSFPFVFPVGLLKRAKVKNGSKGTLCCILYADKAWR